MPDDLKNPPKLSIKKHELDEIDRLIAKGMSNSSESSSIAITLTFRQLKIMQSVLGLLLWLSKVVTIKGAGINLIRSVLQLFPRKEHRPPVPLTSSEKKNSSEQNSNDPNKKTEESTGDNSGDNNEDSGQNNDSGDNKSSNNCNDSGEGKGESTPNDGKPKNINHPGRPDASDYPDAQVTDLYHPTLKEGDFCPLIPCTGKVYPYKRDGEIRSVVTIDFSPPMHPEIYRLHDLRCNLCGAVFKVDLPEEIIAQGATENGGVLNNARAALAIMHYWMGIPFNRLNIFLSMSGKSFPPSSQFDIIETVANDLQPLSQIALKLSADAPFLQGDDIGNKILSAEKELRERKSGKGISLREKVYTSILIATTGSGHMIPSLKTNIGHLGEFIQEVLEKRSPGLSSPVILFDGSKVNTCNQISIVQGGCWQHLLSYFIAAEKSCQKEAIGIIALIREIFAIDRDTRQMSQKGRLAHLQANALPLIDEIQKICLRVQVDKLAIPSSELGLATSYFLNNLPQFLLPFQIPGIPLTNNISEWTTYPSQRYLNNSRHYKNETGAAIGDVIISLALMCLLNHYNPLEAFKYWLHNKKELRKNSEKFLPWNLEGEIPEMPSKLKFNFYIPLQAPFG